MGYCVSSPPRWQTGGLCDKNLLAVFRFFEEIIGHAMSLTLWRLEVEVGNRKDGKGV